MVSSCLGCLGGGGRGGSGGWYSYCFGIGSLKIERERGLEFLVLEGLGFFLILEVGFEGEAGELEGLGYGEANGFPSVEEGGGGVYWVGHGCAVKDVTEVVGVGLYRLKVVVVELPPLEEDFITSNLLGKVVVLVVGEGSDVDVPLTDKDLWVVLERNEVDACVEDEAWTVFVGVVLEEVLQAYPCVIATIEEEMRVVWGCGYGGVARDVVADEGLYGREGAFEVHAFGVYGSAKIGRERGYC